MDRLLPVDSLIVMLNGVSTSQAFPPAAGQVAYVHALWNNYGRGVVPEFEFEICAVDTVDVTALELFGGALRDHTIADLVFTGEADDDTLTSTAHGLQTGDGPVRLTTDGALSGGLAIATDYYVVKTGANTFKLATSLPNALANTTIALSTDGTGTHTLVDVPGSTKRVKWHSYGLLGHAEDGAVSLTTNRGYRTRVRHSPRTIAYGAVATLSSAVAVTSAVIPIVEV